MPSRTVTFDRLESEKAVLISSDGAECIMPATLLPQGSKTGDQLVLTIDQAAAATASREQLAKSILNEILNKKP